jgi:hypothetical protein
MTAFVMLFIYQAQRPVVKTAPSVLFSLTKYRSSQRTDRQMGRSKQKNVKTLMRHLNTSVRNVRNSQRNPSVSSSPKRLKI